MSLSTVLVGEFWADDGDYDEPDGDRPDERVAGSGGEQDQSNGSRDADETWSASGVPAGQGVRQAWPAGAGVPEARPAEQSRLPCGFTRYGHWHHSGAVLGLRPDTGGGEARGASWHSPGARDGSAMDDHGGAMEGSPGPAEGGSSAAVSPRLPGRTDPDRRVRALVVRGSGATMHPARLHRRRHQPPDASAICRERKYLRLFYSDTGVSGALRQAGGVLFRQARCVSGQQEGCDRR